MPIASRLLVLGIACLSLMGHSSRLTAQDCPLTLAQLQKLSACELETLFEQATPGEIPVGYARGQVLLMTEARLPRVRARIASTLWKGKHFDGDGDFINQWPGFKALRGHAVIGTSWHDDKPCLVLDYPAGTPVFGNTRDELRQVGPGLYLARLYEKCPCPRFRGYFAIHVCAACQ